MSVDVREEVDDLIADYRRRGHDALEQAPVPAVVEELVRRCAQVRAAGEQRSALRRRGGERSRQGDWQDFEAAQQAEDDRHVRRGGNR